MSEGAADTRSRASGPDPRDAPGDKGRLRVWVLKEQIRPERLADATVVVIDVFMATTTLVSILDSGARAIYPVGDMEEAELRWDELDPARRLRGGEQMAEPVPGWDCGPYPHEYGPDRVTDRDILYISTNGTAAIARAAETAKRLFISSVRNAPATARHLQEIGADSIYVICAGSLGRLALDDLAGAACLLSHMDSKGWSLNDGARLAWDLADRYGDRIPELLGRARSGRWFFENGKIEEFDFVADVGASEVVAELVDGRLARVDR